MAIFKFSAEFDKKSTALLLRISHFSGLQAAQGVPESLVFGPIGNVVFFYSLVPQVCISRDHNFKKCIKKCNSSY